MCGIQGCSGLSLGVAVADKLASLLPVKSMLYGGIPGRTPGRKGGPSSMGTHFSTTVYTGKRKIHTTFNSS